MTNSSSNTPDPIEQGAVLILDELVRRAIARGASDIHLEPKRDRLQVRLRIDGVMVAEESVRPELSQQVISRIKVLAKLDIAERRVPQDGQLTLTPGGTRVHLRASTFPCSLGEKAVLRVLLGQTLLPFANIGMDDAQQACMREVLERPQGFVITSGPTGSGKTSTLYSCMELLDTARNNVVTLEDPIEVEIPGITQGQTHIRAGFTFAVGLRAILRQDPDVILVGEIRDAETAHIAMQAALTGHLVLSTLHCADAIETIVRLVDLGVEPWIVGNAISCIASQRLVRRACPECTRTVKLDVDVWDGSELLLAKGSSVVRPKGCSKCYKTGYRGRLGIFELLPLDDELRDMIKAKASARAYREKISARKLPSLRRVGMDRVKAGLTTVDEVLRVTM